eukprot:TRINITY_DN5712_c0_g1_i1.p1 TRINITY_DN5712_c0_g1~~TRINITY_DN5712_c0_g1_i1.p1  ORF type:complete len:497 (+),score=170.42 TRINITY_DN5712_c0_g1_i1:109-1491(+)
MKEGKIDVVNPADGTVIKADIPVDTEEQIKTTFERAQKAQQSWASTPLESRKKIIAQFGSLMKRDEDQLAQTLTSEMGKPLKQARGEVAATQDRINFFLKEVDDVLKPSVRRSNDALQEEVRREPLGTIVNISAWNYPFFVGANAFIPGLLTGNSVIYKPSEHTLLVGQHIGRLLQEAGLPTDVFSVVVGGGVQASQLLKHSVDGVYFTGSLETGRKIAQQMAGKMVPVQLKLGGKDPTYVADDADVEKSARSLADGAMYNTGQSCCSVERIYVHQKVYDQFLKTFVEEVKTFKSGDPKNPETYIGPLTLPDRVKFLENQVTDAVKKGASIETGGKATSNGRVFEPTVLTNVNHDMLVMKEESFGPIIGIMKVDSDENALKLMNDTDYGLTAGVYTKNRERALGLMGKINSGTVYWNACDRVSPFLPWNGRKGSGIGSTLGIEGIVGFTRPKSYHIVGPK